MKTPPRAPKPRASVWKLDRLGRSLRDLIEIVNRLEQSGVSFVCLTENIDTRTPNGKLFFHIFGALAEYERELIRERTTAGLTAARALSVKYVLQHALFYVITLKHGRSAQKKSQASQVQQPFSGGFDKFADRRRACPGTARFGLLAV